jgi:hypothetical protein
MMAEPVLKIRMVQTWLTCGQSDLVIFSTFCTSVAKQIYVKVWNSPGTAYARENDPKHAETPQPGCNVAK